MRLRRALLLCAPLQATSPCYAPVGNTTDSAVLNRRSALPVSFFHPESVFCCLKQNLYFVIVFDLFCLRRWELCPGSCVNTALCNGQRFLLRWVVRRLFGFQLLHVYLEGVALIDWMIHEHNNQIVDYPTTDSSGRASLLFLTYLIALPRWILISNSFDLLPTKTVVLLVDCCSPALIFVFPFVHYFLYLHLETFFVEVYTYVCTKNTFFPPCATRFRRAWLLCAPLQAISPCCTPRCSLILLLLIYMMLRCLYNYSCTATENTFESCSSVGCFFFFCRALVDLRVGRARSRVTGLQVSAFLLRCAVVRRLFGFQLLHVYQLLWSIDTRTKKTESRLPYYFQLILLLSRHGSLLLRGYFWPNTRYYLLQQLLHPSALSLYIDIWRFSRVAYEERPYYRSIMS